MILHHHRNLNLLNLLLFGGFNPTPLKNHGVRQLGSLFPIFPNTSIWKNKKVSQTTNQLGKVTPNGEIVSFRSAIFRRQVAGMLSSNCKARADSPACVARKFRDSGRKFHRLATEEKSKWDWKQSNMSMWILEDINY
jgi:hypothetical protein